MNKNIVVALVCGPNGMIDLDASRTSFETEMSKFIVQNEAQEATVVAAIKDVFDNHAGKALTMDAIKTFALAKLNVQPENHSSLSTRITDYVRANNKGDTSLFVSKKGRGGGMMRRSDMTTTESE